MAGSTQIRGGLATLAALSTAAAVHAGDPATPIYVDASVPTGGNGSSWSQAYSDLQDALTVARLDPNPNKNYDVRVAQGVYTPDKGTGNRAMTFLVASGMTLTGGFAGMNAVNPDLRDPSQFVSVLSGDLSRNDIPPFGNTAENAYTVLTIRPQARSLQVEIGGFTVSGGNGVAANAPGGVMTGSPDVYTTIRDCVIRHNQGFRGGGLASSASLNLRDCTIDANGSRQEGGGVYSTATLGMLRCTVTRNFSETSTGGGVSASSLGADDSNFADNSSFSHGGGIFTSGNCTLRNCVIAGNSTGPSGSGGGIRTHAPYPALISCLIAHNTSTSGGGASLAFQVRGMINHCTFVGNTATGYGGAFEVGGTVALTNSVIARNVGSGVVTVTSGELTVHRNLILGGAASLVPSANIAYDTTNFDADPMFENEVGTSGAPHAWRDKDYRLRRGSSGIDAADGVPPPATLNDLVGKPRDVDILVIPNTGFSSLNYRDLGPYEFQRACAADFDGSGQPVIDDLFWFLNLYFVADPLTDVDGSFGVTVDDLFTFLNAWFRGC